MSATHSYRAPFVMCEEKGDHWIEDADGKPLNRDAIIAQLNSSQPEHDQLPGAIKLAVMFHEIYERLAPQYGYETKPETRIFQGHTPNGQLMIAVCRELREILSGSYATGGLEG